MGGVNMNRPKGLKQGDTIGIIAPAGDLREYTIEGIKSSIESYGYKVKILSFRSNIDYKGKWGLLLWEKDFAKFKGTPALGRLCPFSLGLFGI